MALTEKASGSQTTVIGTEHQLGSNQTDAATYLLRIDANAFVAGEGWEMKAKTKVRSTDSHQLEYYWPGLGTLQDDLNHVSIPVASPHSLQFTLKQLNGSARAVPWSILAFGDVLQEKASGSQTATPGTEHNLSSAQTDDETYLLRVDISNLVAGERLELRAKTKTRSADTQRQEQIATYYGESMIVPNVVSVPVPSLPEVQFTLKQVGGTGRAFPWSIVVL
jgi:hypothetical protein